MPVLGSVAGDDGTASHSTAYPVFWVHLDTSY